MKWFGQEQSSFELENEGRLLPVENADLIERVFHSLLKNVWTVPYGPYGMIHAEILLISY